MFKPIISGDKILKRIGFQVKLLRARHDLRQSDVSAGCKISNRHYQDIEYGNRQLRLETLNKILKYYGLHLFNFFEEIALASFYQNGEEELEEFLEEGCFLFAELDEDGLIKRINEHCEKVIGYTANDVSLNMNAQDFIADENEKKFYRDFLPLARRHNIQPIIWEGKLNVKNKKIIRVRGTWRYPSSKNALQIFALVVP